MFPHEQTSFYLVHMFDTILIKALTILLNVITWITNSIGKIGMGIQKMKFSKTYTGWAEQ